MTGTGITPGPIMLLEKMLAALLQLSENHLVLQLLVPTCQIPPSLQARMFLPFPERLSSGSLPEPLMQLLSYCGNSSAASTVISAALGTPSKKAQDNPSHGVVMAGTDFVTV